MRRVRGIARVGAPGGSAQILDPAFARELFRETGIRHTCVTFDATKAVVNDFGSSRSWGLSSAGWAFSGGLTFTFRSSRRTQTIEHVPATSHRGRGPRRSARR
jgi:hypothetical protein